jgi:hypothetical protein
MHSGVCCFRAKQHSSGLCERHITHNSAHSGCSLTAFQGPLMRNAVCLSQALSLTDTDKMLLQC